MFKVFYTLGADNRRHLSYFDSIDKAYRFIEDIITSVDCWDIYLKDQFGEIVIKL